MRRTSTRIAVAAAAALPLALTALAVAPANAATTRSVVRGAVPTWARASADKGHANSADQLDARVYLAPRNASALAAKARAVSTPGNAAYGHYLTPTQYAASYAPTAAQVKAVSAWLTGAGLKVTSSSPHYVAVHGTVAQAEKAFGTSLHTYAAKGTTLRAPSTDTTVPASVAGTVLAVTGLDSADHVATPASVKPFPPEDIFRNAQPCSSYWGEKTASTKPTFQGTTLKYAPCGYRPAQLRGAYGVTASGLTGAGQTVAITDAFASGTIASDAATYAQRNDPSHTWAAGQLTQLSSAPYTRQALCGSNGWYGEETLDVEAVHAMAPAAHVLFAGAKNCFDDSFLDVFHRILDGNGSAPLATIVSNSWSDLEANEVGSVVASYEAVFQQGAVEGVGFYFSSGDDGDETIRGIPATVDYPASDPWATAVGGTSLGVGSTNDYVFETGWGTHKLALSSDGTSWAADSDAKFLYGAGGGTSGVFTRPSYQDGVVTTANRSLPDVSAVGDPSTGMLVGETQTLTKQSRGSASVSEYSEYRIGGTSLSAPLVAGMHALVQQRLGHALGFVNPAIYSLFKANPGAFHDVVDPSVNPALPRGTVRADFVNGVDDSSGIVYTLRTFGQDSSLHAVHGWDDVTGTGSPTVTYLQSLGG